MAVLAVVTMLVNGAWAANKEKVLYSFTGGSDGGDPHSALAFDSAGNAYGTTVTGGDSTFGTVFQLTQHSNGKWTETVLYSFLGGNDGKNPYGGVTVDAKGNLYGTTAAGGSGGSCASDGCGTVFTLTRSGKTWTESILYSFQGGKVDGWNPGGGVIFDPQGNLYGTTADGGSAHGCSGQGCGVVYELSTVKGGGWRETVIHRFSDGKDGSRGSLGVLLLDSAGNLYGVAELGGAHAVGTVFKLTPSGGTWTFSTLDAFRGLPHPGFPYGGVIADTSGNLYGTTYFGGKNGLGSVYQLTNTNGKWKETQLYSFKGGNDGSYPTSTLVFDPAGNLYGTTSAGGDGNDDGVVFKLAPSSGGKWKESVAHRFGNSPDGSAPNYGLVLDKAGNLYGTTPFGGVNNEGAVFELTP